MSLKVFNKKWIYRFSPNIKNCSHFLTAYLQESQEDCSIKWVTEIHYIQVPSHPPTKTTLYHTLYAVKQSGWKSH